MSDWVMVLSEGDRTAKKIHRCDECLRKISIGESYHHEFYVDGSYSGYHKTCQHCMAIRQYVLVHINDTFIYGQLIDEIGNGPMESWKDRLMYAGYRRQWKRKDGKMWKVIK